MTYELALKLKNAGFPNISFECVGEAPHHNHFEDGQFCEWELRRVPTLSELIEACGGYLKCLSYDGKTWWATTSQRFDDRPPTAEGIGSTREIAVANLWLALQENKKGEK